jgi:hypothetical protein
VGIRAIQRIHGPLSKLPKNVPARPAATWEHGRNIRQHHAERCAHDNRVKGLESRGQADRRDLGLVTDLGQEKSRKR